MDIIGYLRESSHITIDGRESVTAIGDEIIRLFKEDPSRRMVVRVHGSGGLRKIIESVLYANSTFARDGYPLTASPICQSGARDPGGMKMGLFVVIEKTLRGYGNKVYLSKIKDGLEDHLEDDLDDISVDELMTVFEWPDE